MRVHPPTIQDVARAAGVGLGTASRALTGHPRVTDATRARVLAAAARLGYRPSPIARALSRGRTQTLEVVVPLATRYFYVEVLRGIEEELALTDYALVIRSIERPADRDRITRDALRGRADGGLVVSLNPAGELLAWLRRVEVPVVLVDAVHGACSSVHVDHEEGAMLAVSHLLELGHRRIALIDHREDPFGPGGPGRRQAGYRRALAQAGIVPPPDYEQVTEFTPEAGARALQTLLRLPLPPTAVFVGSDTQAIGVLDAARAADLRVPEDLAVVGYNDIELAQYLGLTTVRVPMRELGRRAVQLLLRAIEDGHAVPTQVQLAAELVVRRTSSALV